MNRKPFWVARDIGGPGYYVLADLKPKLDNGWWLSLGGDGSRESGIEPALFEKAFGFKMKKGEGPIRVKIESLGDE